jgi:3-hydroxyacyl-[acyl-carrier-protein] dehydratase
MFMHGVRALADAAHAVKRGNAKAGGKISVRAAAHSGFVELPSYFTGDGLSFFVERGDPGGSFHGEAVDAAGNFEFAVFIEGLEGAKFAVDSGGLFRALDAHVDGNGGVRGDDIGAASPLNHAGIHRHALAQIVQLGDCCDLAREFENRTVSLARIESGMGRDAFYTQSVFAYAFAGGFDGAAKSGGRFEHQHPGGLLRQSFGDLSRRVATDFFVGNQEDRDRPRQCAAVPGLQRCDGVQHESDTGLHVENAGAVQAAVFDLAWHVRECAQGIDRVVMAEKEDWLSVGSRASGKIDLQAVAEVMAAVEFSSPAEGFEFLGEKGGDEVDGVLVIAGGFDLDEFANGVHDSVLTFREIAKAFGPCWPRGNHRWLSFLLAKHKVKSFLTAEDAKKSREGRREKPGCIENCATTIGPRLTVKATGYSIIFGLIETTMTESIPPDPEASPSKTALDIHDILRILPHRYPLLLIDRVLELQRKERIVAIKNVTINEPFFNGHFPGLPIMPGVLIVEAIAQAGGALLLTEVEDRTDKVMVFTGIDRAKFRRPVSPGDQLRIEVEVKGWRAVPRMIAAKMHGIAYVAGKKVAEATVSCQLIDSSRGRGDGSEGPVAE